jgi:hypothetical protein
VTRQAFKTLKNIGLLPEGIDERNVHYGVLFADYPYLGPLETMSPNTQHGKRVPSIREDLYGKRPVSASKCLELRYPWSSAERTNLYLAHVN